MRRASTQASASRKRVAKLSVPSQTMSWAATRAKALSESSRVRWVSMVTPGLMARAAAAAVSTLGWPMPAVVWAIWRCQIGKFQQVVVDQADMADAGGGEIEQQRAAETPGADHQHAGGAQFRLAGAADLGEQDMAGIAADFVRFEIDVHAADMAPAAAVTNGASARPRHVVIRDHGS